MKKLLIGIVVGLILGLLVFSLLGIRYVSNGGMTTGDTYFQQKAKLGDKGEKQNLLGIEYYYLNYSYTYETSDETRNYTLTYSISLEKDLASAIIIVTADWKKVILGTEIIYHLIVYQKTLDNYNDNNEIVNTTFTEKALIKMSEKSDELVSLSLTITFLGAENAVVGGIEYLGKIIMPGGIGAIPVILMYGIAVLIPPIIAKKMK